MTARDNAYWDELGVAWSAIDPEIAVIAPRLKQRLRRQSLLITTCLAIGLPISLVGLVLGAFTIWVGGTTGAWNFVTRGMAIAIISLLLARAVTTLLPVRAGEAAQSLSDMLDLAIVRAQRTLGVIRLGLYACLIATVFGLVGTAIRIYLTGPPHLSPVIDLLILAAFALGPFVYGRHTKVSLQKLQTLKQTLTMNGGK